jgi:hypothetical protein
MDRLDGGCRPDDDGKAMVAAALDADQGSGGGT